MSQRSRSNRHIHRVKMATEINRDWSELPPELIERIVGTLDSIADYIIFSAVCKSWQSAARSIISTRQQPPWIFSVDYSADRLHLHNPWKKPIPKTYTFPFPLDQFKRPCQIYVCAYGCLLVYEEDTRTLSLFNPLLVNRSASSWFTLPQLPEDGVGYGRFLRIRYPQLFKYGDGINCVVFASEKDLSPFCWRSGDPSWTKLCKNPVTQYTFYKGSFYFVDFNNQMVIVDASNLTVTSQFPIPNVGKNWCLYLVESTSGELLMVVYGFHGVCQFQVMRVDISQQPPTFVKVSSIGDDALFVTRSHSVICFPAPKSKGLERNCIYHSDVFRGGRYHYLYSLDIANGSTRTAPYVLEKDVRWFIPSLCSVLE